MRVIRFLVVAATLASPIFLTDVAADSSTPGAAATGDLATINFYTSAVNVLARAPGDQQVSSGAFFLGVSSPTSWYLSTDVPHPKYSWQRPAAESEVFAVVHRHITWDTITWTPACPTRHVCASSLPSLRFFSQRGATYWTVLNATRASCWYPAAGSTAWVRGFSYTSDQPWYVGGSSYTTAPDYRPMVRRGGTVTVTSTYNYHDGAHVVETDHINARTRLFTRSTLKVSPYKRIPGFTVTTTVTLMSPTPPHIVLCHGA